MRLSSRDPGIWLSMLLYASYARGAGVYDWAYVREEGEIYQDFTKIHIIIYFWFVKARASSVVCPHYAY